MKVYLLYDSLYKEHLPEYIFSNKEAAEQAVKNMGGDYLDIDEYEVKDKYTPNDQK